MSQDAATTATHAAPRTIFRPAALQHYQRDREKSIVPRYAATPMFACLWALLGLLLTGAAALALTYLARVGGA
jgi:hypothetical protein